MPSDTIPAPEPAPIEVDQDAAEVEPKPRGLSRERLRTNRLRRLGFMFLGIVLFYAPFALVARAVGALAPTSLAGTNLADVHSMCVRMPLGWLVQPWMWRVLPTNPLYWVPVLILPAAAIAAGPLFCGWLCAAGALPEFLGRLVPDRFKFDFKGKVDIVPLRYGFFVGFLFVPFVAASVCCTFCNFTAMQNIVSLFTGNVSAWLYIGTASVITLVLWIVVLGLFTVGGRGWCLFLCPAGSMQSLVAGLTARFGGLARVRHESATCTGCGTCESVCAIRAIDASKPAEDADAPSTPTVEIEPYLCNVCLDCVSSCPSHSLRFGRKR